MASVDTRTLLGESFVELAQRVPFDKISVSDIVAASGKNRKTFYYHFDDKAALVRWIFRNDLAQRLEQRFPADQLVFEKDSEGAIIEAPYYVLVKIGIRSLDGSLFFKTLAETFEGRRSFYKQALASNDAGCLRSYLLKLYTPAIERDVRFMLSTRPLDDASVRFLAQFYTIASIDYMTQRIMETDDEPLLKGTEVFENLIHFSLGQLILHQQLNRSSK